MLTEDQIKHWRNVLLGMIGPYALIMSEDEINILRDGMQERLDQEAQNGDS